MSKHARKAKSKRMRPRHLSDVEHAQRNGYQPEDEQPPCPCNDCETQGAGCSTTCKA